MEYKEKRVKEFRRNNDLESYLKEINNDLWETEKKLINDNKNDNYPLIFMVGPPRSGSTLVLQWLANTKQIAYPTNLLSRFYKAPIIGSKIQRLLTDEKYNYRNEILDFNSEINFISENGKTKGALAPNEFWYFWRRFLPFDKKIDYVPTNELIDYVPTNELEEKMNIQLFKNELNGISNVFEKPFALKAHIMNYNIDLLNKIFDKAIFIYTKRDPYANIESALKARERQFGSVEEWFSFKIPEYYELIKIKDPIKQTAGQIYYINKAVEKGLEKIDESKKVILKYENFCKNPKKYYDELRFKLQKQGYEIRENYDGPENFEVTRKNINNDDIKTAYDNYKNKD